MTHDEAYELLAPLALDALDAVTRLDVERHVLECLRCQGELDTLREVASAMGTTYRDPPPELWEKIAGRLYERPKGEPSSLPVLVPNDRIVPIGLVRAGRVSARTRGYVAAVSAAAAAIIVALAVSLGSAHGQIANLQSALNKSNENPVLSALTTPGHQIVTLRNGQHHTVATFVVLRSGQGYLVRDAMPALNNNKTYQLWGIVNGAPVSIGVMGPSPSQVSFTLVSSPSPSALAVTVEPAGGSLKPARSILAEGAV